MTNNAKRRTTAPNAIAIREVVLQPTVAALCVRTGDSMAVEMLKAPIRSPPTSPDRLINHLRPNPCTGTVCVIETAMARRTPCIKYICHNSLDMESKANPTIRHILPIVITRFPPILSTSLPTTRTAIE